MGKNAKRRKEAKLLEKQKLLVPSERSFESDYEPTYEDGLLTPLESLESLPAVFRSDKLEEITSQLIEELVKEKNFKQEDILQFKELGMKYCRERNSFTSPPQHFGNF